MASRAEEAAEVARLGPGWRRVMGRVLCSSRGMGTGMGDKKRVPTQPSGLGP